MITILVIHTWIYLSILTILGPVWFHIFTGDRDSGTEGTLSVLVDDRKQSGAIDKLDGRDMT